MLLVGKIRLIKKKKKLREIYIMRRNYRRFLVLSLLFCLISCVSREEMVYFQNIKKLENKLEINTNYLEIKANDQLTITVSGEGMEATMPFNLPFVGNAAGDRTNEIRAGGTPILQTYLVNSEGEIRFPVLGSINVLGLNRNELSNKLEREISKYVKNPIVNVKIANFQVSVLGEVNRPGTFSIQDEYLTLPKALGMAGDLTIYGKRNNILVMREDKSGAKQYAYLDLTNADIMNSPFYYLQQNDVVYVEPNSPQLQSASYNRNASVYISIASVLVSLAVLLTR